jgi:hypothetical protein
MQFMYIELIYIKNCITYCLTVFQFFIDTVIDTVLQYCIMSMSIVSFTYSTTK